MIKYIQEVSLKLQTNNYRSIALSILRIFVCVHLLKKIFFSWPSLGTLYGPDSIISHLKIHFGTATFDSFLLRDNYKIIIVVYIVLIVLYLYGIGKYLTALLLYIFTILLHRLNFLVLNGGDNLLEYLLLYLIFADSYQYFSISRLKQNGNTRKISNFVTNLSCYSMMMHLCLIYFVSSIHKLNANVWFHGIAVYYTFSIERFTGTQYNAILVRNPYFVTICTYFALFYELYFPVLSLIKKVKPYYLFLGILLHLGIYLFMMIYDFQFVFIFTYLVFFTNDELIHIKKKVLEKLPFLNTPQFKLFSPWSISHQ
jgi:hypothetical protein